MNDLIERAIQSAEARIYKLQSGKNHTARHQEKAENQIELQKVTVEALEFYKKYKVLMDTGQIQRVECHCKNCVYWSDKVAGATEHVKLCTVGGYMVGENGYCVYAEQALDVKGEYAWDLLNFALVQLYRL